MKPKGDHNDANEHGPHHQHAHDTGNQLKHQKAHSHHQFHRSVSPTKGRRLSIIEQDFP